MLIEVCVAKLHRATVTKADLDYEGSISIGKAILKASGMRPFQYVNITNLSNGVFWRTYIMPGTKGEICLNGPPARHFQKGDKIIVLAEAWIEPSEIQNLEPVVVFFDADGKNTVRKVERYVYAPRVGRFVKK